MLPEFSTFGICFLREFLPFLSSGRNVSFCPYSLKMCLWIVCSVCSSDCPYQNCPSNSRPFTAYGKGNEYRTEYLLVNNPVSRPYADSSCLKEEVNIHRTPAYLCCFSSPSDSLSPSSC